MENPKSWTLDLETKPDFEKAMQRVYAWYEQEIIDRVLQVPGIDAIQWVQGEGRDRPIMPWVPLIRRIQEAGKSVVVDLGLDELDDFISAIDPRGIFLCLSADTEIQDSVLRRIEKW